MPRKIKVAEFTLEDYIKANRRASREEEIAKFGHPLPKHFVHKSKHIYTRKQKHKSNGNQTDV